MWKSRPEENPASSTAPTQPTLSVSSPSREIPRSPEPAKTAEPFRADVAAHIGKSVLVKGQLSGSEDLYLDGQVEGSIELQNHTLVVGPNGRVRADVSAREIVIHGKVEGNIIGAERVELKRSCVLSGDIVTKRIVIEDGASFKGSVEQQTESKTGHVRAAAAASSVAPLTPQPSFMEHS